MKTTICKYCNKTFKHYTDISRHFVNDGRDCYIKFKDEKKNDNRPKVKCEICGVMMRNISNTHCKTKHNITQEDYKNMYPEAKLFAIGLLDIQKKYREKTIKEKYTPEEIYNFITTRVRNYNSLPKEEKIKINETIKKKLNKTFFKNHGIQFSEYQSNKFNEYYANLKKDTEKYEIYKKSLIAKRIKTNMKRYGVKFAQQLELTKEKQKQTLIKNFGSLKNAYDHISSKSIESRMKKYGKIHFCPMFSLKSQELFMELDKQLDNKYTIFYATKGNESSTNEYQILIKNGTVNLRFLDFYVKELNKAIEFNEEYHLSDKQLELDKIRTNEINENLPNIKILYINEKDWEINKKLVISQCLDFLLKDNYILISG